MPSDQVGHPVTIEDTGDHVGIADRKGHRRDARVREHAQTRLDVRMRRQLGEGLEQDVTLPG